MNEYIILHCIYNKESREFVEKHGSKDNVTVLIDDGNELRKRFPYISAFPTVIIPTPAYQITDNDGNLTQIEANIEYIRTPMTWEDVENRINFWKNINK